MRIDYCPQCKKAGLKLEAKIYDNKSVNNKNNVLHQLEGDKWCPRCKMWVKPVSKEWSR